MKHLSKLLALLLATMLVFCASVTVFADNESSEPEPVTEEFGSIKVTQTVAGKVYRIYRIFDLNYVGSGKDLKVSYEMNDDWKPFFETEAGSEYLQSEKGAGLDQIVVDGEVKYINITEGNIEKFAKDALVYAAPLGADKYIEETATGTTLTFDSLPLGYYLIYPVGATSIKNNEAAICAIDSTTPNAEVKVKSQYPRPTKTAEGADTINGTPVKGPVQVGDNVKFTLTGRVPDTTAFTTFYTYRFKDKLSDGLQLNEDSFEIKIDGVKLGTDYYELIITNPVEATEENENTDETSFTVTFDILKMVSEGDIKALQTITIDYSAKVLESAAVKIEDNTAWLEFSNDPTDETSTEETTKTVVKVYSAKVIIDKFSGSNNANKLPGAQFVLYKNVADEAAEDGTKKVYYVWDAENKAVEWVDEVENATVYTTDDNGAAEFIGLEEGTYYLEEVKSPDGYNPLTAPVEVKIEKPTITGDDNKPALVMPEEPVSVTKTISNNTGAELPGAGGIGTTIFYVLGSVLVLGAVVLLVTKKRMSIGK